MLSSEDYELKLRQTLHKQMAALNNCVKELENADRAVVGTDINPRFIAEVAINICAETAHKVNVLIQELREADKD